MLMISAPRAVVHLDVDAFFASVEQRDDPRLRGRPVAVGTGVVASCSYEARCYGVRTAMRLGEAKQRCPSLIILPGEYRRYEQVGRQLLAVCQEQTPLVEAAALDDLYLDVTALNLEGEQVARHLWNQAREEIGISISLGIGGNKLVANVATREVKEAKRRQHQAARATLLDPRMPCLRRVCPGTEQAYLAPWPVRVLPGVGPKVDGRLERLNVQRIATLAQMPPSLLRQLFGNKGRTFHEQARGIDMRPVLPNQPPQTISRRASFDPPVSEPGFLQAMLSYLLERAALWLRYHDLAARGLNVFLRYGDHQSAHGHAQLTPPTDQDAPLCEIAHECLNRLYTRRLPLRLLGVELASLTPADRQGTLFLNAINERQERLTACKDAIRQRFGFTSLVSAHTLTLTRRLPHDRERLQLRTPCLNR